MESEPFGEIDDAFSSAGAVASSWPEVVEVLDQAEIFWLSTTRADGRPHVTPIPAIWLDDMLHFCTGPGEQKAKNLELEPRCVLTTGSQAFRSGMDVVVEGRAGRVIDGRLLRRLAEQWRVKLDWPFQVVEGGFRDPAQSDEGAATGPMAYVFAVFPTKVLAFGKGEPYSQTRFRF